MDKIFLDSYDNIIENIEYDYVFTSPPDFEEIGTDPSKPEIYQEFLLEIFSRMNPSRKLITISFTDRKFGGGIVSKSTILKNVMFELGYSLKSHKIWVKSLKIDMFRLSYSNILTFGKGKTKQNMTKDFKPDVWMHKNEKYKKYAYGMPLEIPIKCIENYTKSGDVVYDPFMGSGTTAVAAIRTGRHYIGSEICPEYFNLSQERLHQESLTILLTDHEKNDIIV